MDGRASKLAGSKQKEPRHERFSEIARPLIERVVRPRMEVLALGFDNAELLEPSGIGWNHCMCVLRHTSRFPATTKLDVSLCPDDDMSHVLLIYRLEILPVLIQFDGHDQQAFPLVEALNEVEVAGWVDAKLESFVDTYLRLENADVYQRENMVRDPVCGMPVNKNWAASRMEHDGRMYYFCIEECRQKFAEAPDRYRAADR